MEASSPAGTKSIVTLTIMVISSPLGRFSNLHPPELLKLLDLDTGVIQFMISTPNAADELVHALKKDQFQLLHSNRLNFVGLLPILVS